MTEGASLFMQAGAEISDCGLYRYRLWRRWSDAPLVLWVMLNPSTADAHRLDPTLRRVRDYALAWGHGGFMVGNLFAYRSTQPRAMRASDAPVGPENDAHLLAMAEECALVLCAWGKGGSHLQRGAHVARLLLDAGVRGLHCLGENGDGTPVHPLYQPAHLVPVPFTVRA